MTQEPLRAFGKAIRLERVAADLTQQQLADAAGINGSYLSGIERGQRNPSLSVAYRLAAALGLSFGELVDRADGLRAGGHRPRAH